MKPERIFLVRHGQSQGNIDHSVYRTTPDHKIELTETGRLQAIEAGKALKQEIGMGNVAFYTS
jgi:broad specificity phosphatase PhoE